MQISKHFKIKTFNISPAQVSVNYEVSHEQAEKIASKEFAKDLPQGIATKDQCLFLLIDASSGKDVHVGYLWYSKCVDENKVYVRDLHIFHQYRNHGFGTKAIVGLDKHLVKLGVQEVGLRVATDNQVAIKLYQSNGFRTTGVNLVKQLS